MTPKLRAEVEKEKVGNSAERDSKSSFSPVAGVCQARYIEFSKDLGVDD
jgi:hypothetical protein